MKAIKENSEALKTPLFGLANHDEHKYFLVRCDSFDCTFYKGPGCWISGAVALRKGQCLQYTTTPFDVIFPAFNERIGRVAPSNDQSPPDTEG